MKSPPVMSSIYCHLFVYDPIEDAQGGKMQIGDRVRFIGTKYVGEQGIIEEIWDTDTPTGAVALVNLVPTITDKRAEKKGFDTVNVPLPSIRLDPQ